MGPKAERTGKKSLRRRTQEEEYKEAWRKHSELRSPESGESMNLWILGNPHEGPELLLEGHGCNQRSRRVTEARGLRLRGPHSGAVFTLCYSQRLFIE